MSALPLRADMRQWRRMSAKCQKRTFQRRRYGGNFLLDTLYEGKYRSRIGGFNGLSH